MLIGWVNSNHYELFLPIQADIALPLEYQIKENKKKQ